MRIILIYLGGVTMEAKNELINTFLESVCKYITTEERAKEIQDELRDHIYSYIEEYKANGIGEEEAVKMALNNMGDPNALSKNYKDKGSNFKRALYTFLIIFVLLINSISMVLYDKIEGINMYSTLFIIIFVDLSFAMYTVDIIKSYKKEKELLNIDPIVYMKSYKQSTWDEKAIKCGQILLFFISLLTFVPLVGNLNNPKTSQIVSDLLWGIDCTTICLYAIICLSSISPKGKNAAIYTEGILTFQYFISWDNIEGYRVDREKIKGKDYYSFVFSFKEVPKFSSISSVMAMLTPIKSVSPIKVSSSQITLIEEIFKNNNIERFD